MEHYEISQTDTGLHIEGFPNAMKVVRLKGPLVKQLSDLALHKEDLEFAEQCLDSINQAPVEPYVIREALWQSSIVHFFKCFGNAKSRFSLSANKIFKEEPPEALLCFKHYKALRDKHLIHDENSYSQSIPGAVINQPNVGHKIAKILCFSATALTLSQDNYTNLMLLIKKTLAWVIEKFDQLCTIVTADLEKEQHERLIEMESLTFRAPLVNDVHESRERP